MYQCLLPGQFFHDADCQTARQILLSECDHSTATDYVHNTWHDMWEFSMHSQADRSQFSPIRDRKYYSTWHTHWQWLQVLQRWTSWVALPCVRHTQWQWLKQCVFSPSLKHDFTEMYCVLHAVYAGAKQMHFTATVSYELTEQTGCIQ